MASSKVTNLSNNYRILPDEMEIFQYTWTITNFHQLRGRVGEMLQSPEFPSRDREDHIKWKLLLHPGVSVGYGQDYISLHLYLASCKVSQVEIDNCKLSIVNAKNEKGFTLEFGEPIKIFGTLGYNYFIPWDNVLCEENNYLRNNQLIIFCEIRIKSLSQSLNIPYNISVPSSTLSRDFGHIYDSQKFCDVALYVDGVEFKAHKAILSVRSEVFRETFESRTEKQVEVSGIDASTFGEMLRFIYTGEVMNLSTSADKLLAAANTFKLERLKFMCGMVISEHLTEENAYKILELANLYNATDLKYRASSFIARRLARYNHQNGNC